jgi:transposase
VIIIGIDPHKKSHTAVAVEAATGRAVGQLTVGSDGRGHIELLTWARELVPEHLFALEDCRSVSGRLERFLLTSGETVIRVSPKLMGAARRASRSYGKSDPIDARAIAEAVRREPSLPLARLAEAEHDLRLLVDHRDDLVAERTRLQNRLRWHLHDLGLGEIVPAHSLHSAKHLDRLESELALFNSVRARIARQLIEHCRTLSTQVDKLQYEIGRQVSELAPELLTLPGCGVLSAARLLAETGGAARFRSEAAFAMHVGVAPLPASSGNHVRYRLNRRGNRRLNATLHRIAITQIRLYESARTFMERKQREGKSKREALRCLKRHLARRVFALLRLIDRRLREQERDLQISPVVFAQVLLT